MKCENCGALVYDAYTTKQRINLMYQMDTNVGWAKNRLRILIEMLEERIDNDTFPPVNRQWMIDDLKKTMNGLETIAEKENKQKVN